MNLAGCLLNIGLLWLLSSEDNFLRLLVIRESYELSYVIFFISLGLDIYYRWPYMYSGVVRSGPLKQGSNEIVLEAVRFANLELSNLLISIS